MVLPMEKETPIEDRASENWDKVKGKTNEVVGAARGDLGQEMKGKGQQLRGHVKEGVNDARDRADERA